MPVLVQRIIDCFLEVTETNIDQRFNFDYMGAAEFEHGILWASLKLMRSQQCDVEPLRLGKNELWFCGNPEYLKDARAFVSGQINNTDENNYKENPYLKLSLEKDRARYIGWWWLSQNGWPDKENASKPTWCVFLNKEHAIRWAECCN